MGLTWVHFILKSKSGTKEVEYAERRRRRMAGSGTAACLINMTSGSVQVLLWGSALRAAVSQ